MSVEGAQPCGCVLWAEWPGQQTCCQEHEAKCLRWLDDPENYVPCFKKLANVVPGASSSDLEGIQKK